MAKLLIIVGSKGEGKTTILHWLKQASFMQIDEPASYSTRPKEMLEQNKDCMIAMSRSALASLEADEEFAVLRRFHQVKILKLYTPQ